MSARGLRGACCILIPLLMGGARAEPPSVSPRTPRSPADQIADDKKQDPDAVIGAFWFQPNRPGPDPPAMSGLFLFLPSGGVCVDALSGSGHFPAAGPILLNGDVRPGTSPGVMQFDGDVIFGPFSVLEIEIGGLSPGTGHDKLQVGQTAYLDGTLELLLINGFVPQPGERFEIIRASQVIGTFSNVSFPPAPPLPWAISYEGGRVLAFVAVPPDFDRDNDVDGDDLALLNSCRSRAEVPYPVGFVCQKADLDNDGDVDPDDFGLFQRCYSGAGIAPPIGCFD